MTKTTRLTGRAVLVVNGARTPFLKARGRPGPFSAADLAHAAGRCLLSRLGLEPEQIEQMVLGCVSAGPDEANVARVVALRLGCGERVDPLTGQRNSGT